MVKVFERNGLVVKFETPDGPGLGLFPVYFYCSEFAELLCHAEVIGLDGVGWSEGLTGFSVEIFVEPPGERQLFVAPSLRQAQGRLFGDDN